MNVKKIFKELYRTFGPQGWWPTTRVASRTKNEKRKTQNWKEASDFAPHYRPMQYHRRLTEWEKFEIAIGAILTQNTAWKNVEKAIVCLHRDGLMSPQAILSAPIGTLRKCIKSSGYYKQKAKKVRIFCRWLVKKHGGELGRFFTHTTPSVSPLVRGRNKTIPLLNKEGLGEVMVLRAELLSLWGIGPETADSILLYAGGLPTFVVDAYTRRLCEKYGVKFVKYEEYQRFFADGLNTDFRTDKHRHTDLAKVLRNKVTLYQEYHALVVKWGKEYGLSRRS